MEFISPQQVDSLLDYHGLSKALVEAFSGGVRAPTRHHHTIERPDDTDSAMLLMPAWTDFEQRSHSNDGFIGVKIATVSPDNNDSGQPAVMATYLLAEGKTGKPLALIDGQALTLWRTATASALAGRYLAPAGATTMAMIGAGKLAPHLIRAHAAMHPIKTAYVWNRNLDHAMQLAARLADEEFETIAIEDREAAIARADIVSAATITTDPLIEGRWLKPGTHIDLVGAFSPGMRESDDEAVLRSSLFVDTFDGALKEGGDLVQPIEAGLISRSDIKADLAMLCRGDHCGRSRNDEITLFKSTGAALEDFAAGCLVWERFKTTTL